MLALTALVYILSVCAKNAKHSLCLCAEINMSKVLRFLVCCVIIIRMINFVVSLSYIK